MVCFFSIYLYDYISRYQNINEESFEVHISNTSWPSRYWIYQFLSELQNISLRELKRKTHMHKND